MLKGLIILKISCNNYDLLEALQAVQKASSSNTSFPILECILFEADDLIKLTGNNLEIAIEYTIDGDIIEKGQTAVNSKIICEIIRRMPEGNILIETTAEGNIKISCGELEFNINGISGDDFPKIPDTDTLNKIEITADVLSSLVKTTSFAVAISDMKPILTGIKLEFKDNEITAAAVDGYRLAVKTVKTENKMPECSCVIPGKSLTEFCKITGSADEEIIINISDKSALFDFGRCKFFTRLLEGEFINYTNIIPKEYKYNLEVSVSDLIKSVDRAALMSESDSNKTPIKVIYDNDKMSVLCTTQRGSVTDVLNVKSEGNEIIEVGYNCKYLMDALKAASTQDVKIEITGSINPTVIKPVEGDDFIFIVLPVRLK